jgi:hypothetical protein
MIADDFATSNAAEDCVFLANLLPELDYDLDPTPLTCHNAGAVRHVRYTVANARIRYANMLAQCSYDCKWVMKCYKHRATMARDYGRAIPLCHIGSNYNVSDTLLKNVDTQNMTFSNLDQVKRHERAILSTSHKIALLVLVPLINLHKLTQVSSAKTPHLLLRLSPA